MSTDTSPSNDRWLYILSRAPFDGANLAEAVDALLVCGVFERNVSVLIIEDAVQVLRSEQDGQPLGFKTVAKQVTALPDYDVTDIFVCKDSAARAGLAADDVSLPVEWLDLTAQKDLIATCNAVFSD